jgi:hypothetical protein
MEESTFGALHGGDIVQGAEDGLPWGVEYVSRSWLIGSHAKFEVALVRHGQRVIGWPAESDPVNVIQRADTAWEASAFETLAAAGLQPEVILERWTNAQE